jgi:hypothetical protein
MPGAARAVRRLVIACNEDIEWLTRNLPGHERTWSSNALHVRLASRQRYPVTDATLAPIT